MRLNKIKLLTAGLAMAAALLTTGVTVNAETKVNDTVVIEIGTSQDYYYVTNLKINGKAPKKLKKKVKSVEYSKNTPSSTYRTKNYFNTTSAYATINDYNKENGSEAYKYYPANSSWELDFKKAGTYKVSYTAYSYNDEYIISEDDDGNDVIKKYNIQKDIYDVVGKYVNVSGIYTTYANGTAQEVTTYELNGKTYNRAVEDYYACENGQNYAFGSSGDLVPVSIQNGADGKPHVKYSPNKRISYTNVDVFKVVPSRNVYKQVKLGNSYVKKSHLAKLGGYFDSKKGNVFLKGASGKLSVKMDSEYTLTSVLAGTYDADGNYVYKKAANGGTVAYGQNYSSSKSEEGAKIKYFRESLYKPTTIYLFYKDKTTGTSTTVTNEGVDAEGNQTFTIEVKEREKNNKTGKYELLTDTYTVTRKKPYAESKSYLYYYEKSYQYIDYKDGSIKSDKYTGSQSSLPGLSYNYTTVNFYTK